MSSTVLGIATQIMVMAIVISVVLLFLGIGVLVLIHVCIVGRALRRGLNGIRGDRGTNHTNGMSQEDLQRLPCFDYDVGEKGCSPVDCAVCLESFQKGDRCRLLPICKHGFHAQCVDSWLLKTPICPICRTSANASSSKGAKVLEEDGSSHSHLDVAGVELGITQPVTVAFPVSSTPSQLHSSPIIDHDQEASSRITSE